MAVSQEHSVAHHPSLFLTCRLAQVVQKFKHHLRQRIQVRRKSDNPCGTPYRRGLRLRALSNLEKITTPRRASIDQPIRAVERENHDRWVNSLLRDLDDRAHSKIYSLTKIAANDKLLLSHAEDTLLETFAQHISLSQASYLFDLTTLLLGQFQSVRGRCAFSTEHGHEYEPECKRLKDELFLANMIHLLRRLQHMLFQSLIRRSLQALDEYADQWRGYWIQKRKLDDWFAEWPDSQPPFSATMPWNIRPSLVVLWGVCWMFYVSKAGMAGNSDNQDAVPPQPATGSADFWSSWEDNAFLNSGNAFPVDTSRTTEGREDYSHADDGSLPLSQYTSSASAGIYPTTNQSSRLPSQPHQTTSATRPALSASISRQDNPYRRQHQNQLASSYVGSNLWYPISSYNNGDTSSTTGFSSRDTTWPEFSGGNFSYASSQPQQPESIPTSNVWQAPQHGPVQSLFSLQTATSGSCIPQVTVSPVSAPPSTQLYLNPLDAAILHDRQFSLPTELEQQIFHTTMGGQEGPSADISYPSPHSVKNEDFGPAMSVTSQSSGNPGVTALVQEPHPPTTSPSSEGSHGRNKLSIRRNQEPPKTEDGFLYCDHPECELRRPTFRRPCEWNKHMDKHERPYKCPDPACEKIQGFTYSGGLLRHEREVHKKNAATKKLLFCHFSNCNRHTGHGFTRKENLNEHLRRRHNQGPHDETPASNGPLSPDARQELQFMEQLSPPSIPRKRKREEDAEPQASPSLYKIQRHDSTDSEDLRGQISQLRREAEVKEHRMRQLEETVKILSARLPPPK